MEPGLCQRQALFSCLHTALLIATELREAAQWNAQQKTNAGGPVGWLTAFSAPKDPFQAVQTPELFVPRCLSIVDQGYIFIDVALQEALR